MKTKNVCRWGNSGVAILEVLHRWTALTQLKVCGIDTQQLYSR